jgi:hypothetical protein
MGGERNRVQLSPRRRREIGTTRRRVEVARRLAERIAGAALAALNVRIVMID